MKNSGCYIFILLGLFYSPALFSAEIDTIAAVSPTDTTAETLEDPISLELPFQRFNFKTNALYFLNRNWNATIDMAVAPHFTLGVTYLHGSSQSHTSISSGTQVIEDTNQSAIMDQIGITMNYYLFGTRQTDSVLISPMVSLSFNSISRKELVGEWQGKHTGFALGLTVSKQWMWPSGFNFQLGAGFLALLPGKTQVANIADPSNTKLVENPGGLFGNILPMVNVNTGIAL